MKRASTFALTIAILLTGVTPAQSASETATAAAQPAVATVQAPRPEKAIHTDNADLAVFAQWALGRYAQAGLELPALNIYFHENNESCKGYSALHRRSEAGSQIDICSTIRTPKLEGTILHEMAHAWAAHNLTDQQRQTFIELQGLDAWYDKDASWNERGTEQAAEIIAWGLGETSRPPRWIPNNDPESLTTAYQQLTGTDPITDNTDEWQEGQPPPRTPAQSTAQSATSPAPQPTTNVSALGGYAS